MPIEYRPIDDLTAYKNNPRKHPEKQLVKLAASITQFGFAIPVLIDEAGVIIAGEARVAAARRERGRHHPLQALEILGHGGAAAVLFVDERTNDDVVDPTVRFGRLEGRNRRRADQPLVAEHDGCRRRLEHEVPDLGGDLVDARGNAEMRHAPRQCEL
ncbi:ParB N-terminal domain-containing protein [Aurantimonas aggregata]